MTRPIVPLLAICLMTATGAQAQMSGGHGHGGGRGGRAPGGSTPGTTPDAPSTPRSKPMNQIEIVGVVTGIDAGTDRLTIAYDAVEALNWPAGAMPFVVSKTALLKDVSVGEKIRFHLDSQQIVDLKPFDDHAAAHASSITADMSRP